MLQPLRNRTALVTASLALAAAPLDAGTLTAPISAASSSYDAPQPQLGRVAATPKVGTYEGTFGPKGNKTYFALDVTKRKGSFRVKQAVVLYYCAGGEVDGEPGSTYYSKLKVRRGRFSSDVITSIRGSFTTRKKVTGSAQPAPGLFGCTGKPHPFTARYVGPSVDRTGSYSGADATAAAVTFEVKAGRVLDTLSITRRLQCGNHQYGSLFQFGRAAVTHAGTVSNTALVDDVIATTFTYSATFDAAGGVTGTYQVSAAGCDTGVIAFSASRTG